MKHPHTARAARAADEGIATDGEKWVAICDRHGTFVAVRTKRDAKSSTTVDFCDECRELEDDLDGRTVSQVRRGCPARCDCRECRPELYT